MPVGIRVLVLREIQGILTTTWPDYPHLDPISCFGDSIHNRWVGFSIFGGGFPVDVISNFETSYY